MHVFLDTNILYNKFKLDNSVISGLKTYLRLTKSKAYLSEVSFKELVFKYKGKLEELKIEVLEKNLNNLNYHKKHDFTEISKKIEKL
jgi:predicted nucleic acid-binding protein